MYTLEQIDGIDCGRWVSVVEYYGIGASMVAKVSHNSIVRMKMIAPECVWWPRNDGKLENLAKSCCAWQRLQKVPAVAPLHPWIWLPAHGLRFTLNLLVHS